jgi:hypothetical protein
MLGKYRKFHSRLDEVGFPNHYLKGVILQKWRLLNRPPVQHSIRAVAFFSATIHQL